MLRLSTHISKILKSRVKHASVKKSIHTTRNQPLRTPTSHLKDKIPTFNSIPDTPHSYLATINLQERSILYHMLLITPRQPPIHCTLQAPPAQTSPEPSKHNPNPRHTARPTDYNRTHTLPCTISPNKQKREPLMSTEHITRTLP